MLWKTTFRIVLINSKMRNQHFTDILSGYFLFLFYKQLNLNKFCMFVLNTAFIMCVISSSLQKPDITYTLCLEWGSSLLLEHIEHDWRCWKQVCEPVCSYVRDFKLPCVEKDSIVFIGISSVFGAFLHFRVWEPNL